MRSLAINYEYLITVQSIRDTDTSQSSSSKVTFKNFIYGQPSDIHTINKTATTVSIAWSDYVHGSFENGYRVYLRNEHGVVIDSLNVDSSIHNATFNNLIPEKIYKINVATVTDAGVGQLDSAIVYDTAILKTSYAHYGNFRLPWVYVSTYSKPDDYEGKYAGKMKGVTGGIFTMGSIWGDSTSHIGSSEKPVHEVQLSSFLLGTYEVTNSQLLPFLNEHPITIANEEMISGNDTIATFRFPNTNGFTYDSLGDSMSIKPGKENFPVTNLYWKGAVLFCNWVSKKENLSPCYDTISWTCDFSKNGYRLPTDAEFEYVASGAFTGNKQRFPWGYHPSGKPIIVDLSRLAPVGSGINSYGWYEIAGSVQEYLNDWSDVVSTSGGSTYYQQCLLQGLVIDPKGPQTGTDHLMRSGSFEQANESNSSAYMSTWRYTGACNNPSDYGMRLARKAP